MGPAGRAALRPSAWTAWLLAAAAWLFALGAQAAGQAFASPDWWVAVRNDDAATVKRMLAAGVDPNVRNERGQPALMQAVRDDAWAVYDVLAADPRTDVEVLNPAQETPLMYVALVGQYERAKALLARGAAVNRLGWTPLHYAAAKGHAEVARLLLDHGAMPNAPAPDGTSPLMMAVRANSVPTVQVLLDAGADPSARNLAGQDAHVFAQAGIARTYQIPRPFSHMTVLENVAIVGMYGGRGKSRAEAMKDAHEFIEFAGLTHRAHALPDDLNLHQRKFLELARALAAQPKLLLLDEVLSGLTPSEINEAIAMIQRIRDRGTTIVFVEHVMRAVMALTDRIVVLNHGALIAQGNAADVMNEEDVKAAYLGKAHA